MFLELLEDQEALHNFQGLFKHKQLVLCIVVNKNKYASIRISIYLCISIYL